MPTIQKTVNFDSGAEGLVDLNDTDATSAFQSGDSQSGSGGCYGITCGSKSVTVTNFCTQAPGNGGTNQTWEDWGVPPGSTITGMEVISYYWKVANNSKLSTFTDLELQVDTSLVAQNFLCNTGGLGTAITGWTAATITNGGMKSLTPVASNTAFNLLLYFGFTTSGGGGTAAVDIRIDTITYEITYTAPTSPSTEVKYVFGYLV